MYTYLDSAHISVADVSLEWVTLSWTEPTVLCQPSEQQYSVTCSGMNGNTSITTTNTTYTFTDLTPLWLCNCTVKAVLESEVCGLRSPQVLFIQGQCMVLALEDIVTACYPTLIRKG